MANEVRGILYETIAEAALQIAIKSSKISGELFWNVKPTNLSIVPDFTIGKDKDAPTHVILITASGAEHNSHMKSWRNLGEMQEAKAQLASIPVVINLYFKSELKAGVAAAADHLYDVILHIGKKPYSLPLENWVAKNTINSIKKKEERRELLVRDVKSDSKLADSVQALAGDLTKALKARKSELHCLWKLMREDYQEPHSVPVARDTFVRRGLAKLSVLEPEARKVVYGYQGKLSPIPTSKLPMYALTPELGFFLATVAGVRLHDTDISSVITLLGATRCEAVLQTAPVAMQTWIIPLRNLDKFELHANWD